MTIEELREDIEIEAELIEAVLAELEALRQDVAHRKPTVRATTFTGDGHGPIQKIPPCSFS